MAVSLLNFKTLVNNAATAVQGACQQTLDLTVGSVIRALLEATSAVALWLQYLALQILTTVRLSTSNGAFVDSFVADFGLARLPGTPATGAVVFSSFTPGNTSAIVPVGATVRTGSAITYTVYAETTNPAFDPVQQGYVRTLGTASVTAPVQCTVGGAQGNVSAGVINLLGTAIPNIDTASNPAALVDGADGETDDALRVRFVSFINSRSQGTLAAVRNAVTTVQTGLLFQIAENSDSKGGFQPGNFVVVVDDGSGNPPQTLLAAIYAAVDLVRPIGASFQTIAPTVLPANVAMTLTLAAGANPAVIRANVATAITKYLAGLTVGAPASYSALIRIAYAVDAINILNVTDATLNGGTVDLAGVLARAIRAGTITVT